MSVRDILADKGHKKISALFSSLTKAENWRASSQNATLFGAPLPKKPAFATSRSQNS